MRPVHHPTLPRNPSAPKRRPLRPSARGWQCVLGALMLSACQEGLPTTPPTSSDSQYLVLIADNGANRVRLLDPRSGEDLWTFLVENASPSLCGKVDCTVFGAQHHNLEDVDLLTLSYGAPSTSPPSLTAGFKGQVERWEIAAPPRLRWRLNRLDFSGLPGGAQAYCAASPTDPCQSDPSAPASAQALCQVGDTHDFVLMDDDPGEGRAELLLAETDTYRMLRVRFDYEGGNTCGKVLAVADRTRTPGWYPAAQPNSVVPLRQDGRDFFLVTFRSVTTNGSSVGSEGLLQLWELTRDTQWTLHWTWPDQPSDGSLLHVAMPHGGALLSENGALRFIAAQSMALSTSEVYSPVTSPGGSLVQLELDPLDLSQPPNYLRDLYVPSWSSPWTFPRFAAPLPDGSLLVTDSGCIGGNCPYPGRLIWVSPDSATDSPLPGYWTSDHDQLELQDHSDRQIASYQCGLRSPFWALPIGEGSWGASLRAMVKEGGAVCSE